ncbi:MAG: hypothetical protein LUH04_00765 [Clostridium sp.]|nr:hypothetical protein [Clostridium sp.]
MPIDFYLPEMIAYAASCMSLFRHCGIRQTRPFAIICNGISQQDELADHLKIFTDNRIHSLKSFAAHPLQFINAAKDDILFLQYAQDSQAGYLPWLCEILAEGYCEEEPINCLVCVLYNGYLPAEETDFFSVIVPVREVEKVLGTRLNGRRIQQKLADQKTALYMLWEALKRKTYQEYMCESPGDDEEILYAAAVIADIQKGVDSLQELCSVVGEKLAISRDSCDRSDLPDLFVRMLHNHSELLYPMTTYYHASKTVNEDVQCVLYDENFYYLPGSVMERILAEMAGFAGAEEIKRTLAEAGCLDIQGSARRYYTQKITVGGKRLHYFKLKRAYIDQAGEATLAAICELKGERQI